MARPELSITRLASVLLVALALGTLFPSAALAAQPSTIVVEIGGIGTDQTPGGPWTAIEPYLIGAASFRHYDYDTCGDISTNVHELVQYLDGLRPNHVVLAGHSMGGVLALSALSTDDLTGLVQGVVIADAPINGISPDLVSLGQSLGLVPFPCRALDQIQSAYWASASADAAQHALANGIGLLDVSNGYDNMVPLVDQQLPQQVNLRFDVSTGFVNHTAVFSSTPALSAMAQFIRSL